MPTYDATTYQIPAPVAAGYSARETGRAGVLIPVPVPLTGTKGPKPGVIYVLPAPLTGTKGPKPGMIVNLGIVYQWAYGDGYSKAYKYWPKGEEVVIDGGPRAGKIKFTVKDEELPIGSYKDAVQITGLPGPYAAISVSSPVRTEERVPWPSDRVAARGTRMSFLIEGLTAADAKSTVPGVLHGANFRVIEEPGR